MRKPSLIYRFLENLLPPDVHHLIGDLEEEFHLNKTQERETKARLLFWIQLFRSTPLFIIQSIIWNTQMISNYLKVSWRTLKKHLGFSFINIFGLAASMSVCLLIILFVAEQISFDQFHEKKDRIVRITSDFRADENTRSNLYATSPGSLADLLEEKFPEVERVIKIRRNFGGDFRFEDKVLAMEGFFADPAFLSEFSFELIEGNPETALSAPGSVLLTPESALKFFGKEHPIGKTLTGLGDRDYTVTGIINNEVHTHFLFDAIASYSTLTTNTEAQARLDNWKESIYNSMTYLVMNSGTDLTRFEERIQPLIQSHYTDPKGEYGFASFQVQPLTKINLGLHLSNEVGIVMPGFIVWFLLSFTTIIILIAVFNYMSLTVARSLSRGKEVGVRKVLGAYRSGIVKQFLAESIMFSIISVLFAAILLRWLIPGFNNLFFVSFTNSQLNLAMIFQPAVFASILAFTLLVGILAGIYPSLYLSSFNPSKVLKGLSQVTGVSSQGLKKFITVSQFTVSIIFITTSLILLQQFQHMANSDYGFDRENLVNIALQDVPYSLLSTHLGQSPDVISYTTTSQVPAIGSRDAVFMKMNSQKESLRSHGFWVDEKYLSTMNIDLLSGRNFDPDFSTDTTSAIILSDEATFQLGFKNPEDALDSDVLINDEIFTIIGIIEGFISGDAWRAGDPIVLFYHPQGSRYATVKIHPERINSFITDLETTWLVLNSLHALNYQIFDQQIKESPQLSVLTDFIKILSLVGGFTIFISCLGLFGMAVYSTENRVKEIGIRKVMGASVQSIVMLLSKEYLLLIGIAILIAMPSSWFINKTWMQVITNKVPIHPGLFITGILLTITLALLTIGVQTLRAARTKTIENLRSE